MPTLRDELKRKFSSPQQVLEALGLDAGLIAGDSGGEIKMNIAARVKAVANRTVSVRALMTHLKPRLAMDAKINYLEIFKGARISDPAQRKIIVGRIRSQAKLAKDANLDDVEKVMDLLAKHDTSGDADVPDEDMPAIEEAAGASASMSPVGEDEHADLRGFLAGKGMGEDDINTACGMAKPKAATDEFPPKKEGEEDEETKKKREAAAKDAEMKKDAVTKPAMDEAIKVAVEATEKRVIERERGIRTALTAVRPWVGELTMAFDSGPAVYRQALIMLGVDGAKTIHDSALEAVLKVQQKPGDQRREAVIALDGSQVAEVNKQFPHLARLVS